jgi:hypothetical protein
LTFTQVNALEVCLHGWSVFIPCNAVT